MTRTAYYYFLMKYLRLVDSCKPDIEHENDRLLVNLCLLNNNEIQNIIVNNFTRYFILDYFGNEKSNDTKHINKENRELYQLIKYIGKKNKNLLINNYNYLKTEHYDKITWLSEMFDRIEKHIINI